MKKIMIKIDGEWKETQTIAFEGLCKDFGYNYFSSDEIEDIKLLDEPEEEAEIYPHEFEENSCKGQHNFVFSHTTNEILGYDSTGSRIFNWVICTKCGLLKKSIPLKEDK